MNWPLCRIAWRRSTSQRAGGVRVVSVMCRWSLSFGDAFAAAGHELVTGMFAICAAIGVFGCGMSLMFISSAFTAPL